MIEYRGLSPYYFPTTVVFIDDDENFLDNLSLSLPQDLAFRVYSQPRQALEHIREVTSEQPVSSRCFSVQPDSDARGTADAPQVTLDLEPITETLYTEHRFTEVSVVVIDYDMPVVDGLEVCRQLRSKPMKKVLLTGKADESIAIEAFNEGLIDQFISKGSPGAIDYLQQSIHRLQREYFRKVSVPITHALGAHTRAFLSDPAFVAHFKQLAEQHEWVEHYLSTSPNGLLCLDAGGNPTLLTVTSRDQLGDHATAAREQGAPPELVGLLERGEVVPNPNHASDTPDWRRDITLAQQVPGSDSWFLALVDESTHLKVSPERLLNYRYYLEILEYMGHAAEGG